jgi:shikimate dehydrogenase
MSVASSPRLLGLIGWPVEHSLSPAMHQAALDALGLPWVYAPLPVLPGAVGDAVRGLRALGFVGANVTVPHKQAVIPFLDRLSPAAAAIGAVNTITLRQAQDERNTPTVRPELVEGQLFPNPKRAPSSLLLDTAQPGVLEWPQLVGDNTDAAGFLADLRAHGVDVRGQQALVIGAGGASRAVVYALASAGCRVVIVNRTPARAREVAEMVAHAWPGHAVTCGQFPDDIAAWVEQVDLVVNTTSLGMWPANEGLPWDPGVAFRPGQVVYDLVYTPRLTRFLRRAAADGARPIDGLGMLVEQGAAALAQWTGLEPPRAIMRAAAEQELDRRFSA